MEKPIFPSKYIRITQGYNVGTHKDSFAIDNAGKDGGISTIYAPFTGIIKKIYSNDANEVWLESNNPVEFADGTKDYLTVLFAHCNNVSNLFVGKEIKQNEAFYQEGTKGNATGNHCHIECGKGKFTGTGWHKNNAGYWSINNGKKPEECFWLDNTITIIDTNGYNFKKISTSKVEKENTTIINNNTKASTVNKNKNQTTQKENNIKNNNKPQEKTIVKFKAPKKDLYGIYLNKDEVLTVKINQE